VRRVCQRPRMTPERLLEADEDRGVVIQCLPCDEKEVAVPYRHAGFAPLVADDRHRDVLGRFVSVPENSALTVHLGQGPRHPAAAPAAEELPAVLATFEHVIHQVVRTRQEGQASAVASVRRDRRTDEHSTGWSLLQDRVFEGGEVVLRHVDRLKSSPAPVIANVPRRDQGTRVLADVFPSDFPSEPSVGADLRSCAASRER
jgi:hypothetical protein